MNVVWFKRDLRLSDHDPLRQALLSGEPVLLLYIFEPELWSEPDMSRRHYEALKESLEDLCVNCKKHHIECCIKVGAACDIFRELHEKYIIKSVYSHQETWNNWTYQRDLNLKSWFEVQGILWKECQQTGVVRCLKSRDGWSKQWAQFVTSPIEKIALHSIQCIREASDSLPLVQDLGCSQQPCPKRQSLSRRQAEHTLETFFKFRGRGYTRHMSSPVTAFDACSRMSVYLAFGIMSIREVYQYAMNVDISNKNDDGKRITKQSFRSFVSRLSWHCHFIQKLETQPSIEFHAFHPNYEGIRPTDVTKFEAFTRARTGFPFVDACLIALRETGWLNFRMRAMLMSFATNHLWLNWRDPALFLAQQFLDYEPGIHYSQCQMQAGITGINAIRIYNPFKQSYDQDPEGTFIKTWVPELKNVDSSYIHEPHNFPLMAIDYPTPIVDEAAARKFATQSLYAARQGSEFRDIAKQIYNKHGSRKRRS